MDTSDEILITPENELTFRSGSYYLVPNEAASDPKFVKHVRCVGARFHVLYWDSNGEHCSETNCIINKRE